MDELKKNIEDYLSTLKSKEKVIDIIKKELNEIKDNFSIPRRTEIVDYIDDVQDEDLIKKEEMAVTVSHSGYIKRVPLSTYRSQNRGGKADLACRQRMKILLQIYLLQILINPFYFSHQLEWFIN
jgi:DNA gyrase subunit A